MQGNQRRHRIVGHLVDIRSFADRDIIRGQNSSGIRMGIVEGVITRLCGGPRNHFDAADRRSMCMHRGPMEWPPAEDQNLKPIVSVNQISGILISGKANKRLDFGQVNFERSEQGFDAIRIQNQRRCTQRLDQRGETTVEFDRFHLDFLQPKQGLERSPAPDCTREILAASRRSYGPVFVAFFANSRRRS